MVVIIPAEYALVAAWLSTRVNQFITNALCYVEWQLIEWKTSLILLLCRRMIYYINISSVPYVRCFYFLFFSGCWITTMCRRNLFFSCQSVTIRKSLMSIHYSRSFSPLFYNGCVLAFIRLNRVEQSVRVKGTRK